MLSQFEEAIGPLMKAAASIVPTNRSSNLSHGHLSNNQATTIGTDSTLILKHRNDDRETPVTSAGWFEGEPVEVDAADNPDESLANLPPDVQAELRLWVEGQVS